MIVNMSNNATPDQINHIIERIKECGFQAHVVEGAERTIIGAIGSSGRRSEIEALRAAPGVAEVIQISHPFKLVSRQLRQAETVVDVAGTKIGAGDLVVIAGPCSVESEEQLMETARAVKASGANMLRGGAYKPRTSPYDFQGLGVEALRFLRNASKETGLPIVTEVMSEADVEIVEEYADMMQFSSNVAHRRPLKSGCLRLNTCSPVATRTWCCVNAASRPSKPRPATLSTSPQSHS
jgi:3-deoxy-7-phosphoheptulonate synthase